MTDLMPSCFVHTLPVKKGKNAALSLRLGVESTLFRHEKGDFQKTSSNWTNLKTPFLCFSVDRNIKKEKSFSKTPLNSQEFENTGFAIL